MVAALFDEVAFLGRYGHQPAGEVLRMTQLQRRALVEAVSKLISAEDAERRASEER